MIGKLLADFLEEILSKGGAYRGGLEQSILIYVVCFRGGSEDPPQSA